MIVCIWMDGVWHVIALFWVVYFRFCCWCAFVEARDLINLNLTCDSTRLRHNSNKSSIDQQRQRHYRTAIMTNQPMVSSGAHVRIESSGDGPTIGEVGVITQEVTQHSTQHGTITHQHTNNSTPDKRYIHINHIHLSNSFLPLLCFC